MEFISDLLENTLAWLIILGFESAQQFMQAKSITMVAVVYMFNIEAIVAALLSYILALTLYVF